MLYNEKGEEEGAEGRALGADTGDGALGADTGDRALGADSGGQGTGGGQSSEASLQVPEVAMVLWIEGNFT